MEYITPELQKSVALARLRCSIITNEIQELQGRIKDNQAYLETVKERLEAAIAAHNEFS